MTSNSDAPDTSFEKYKYKVELFKWLIGSVALVVMTTIIDWGFKDRAAGLQEIEQYDKYATELIVLNNDPVKKRMLAQFFSKVTPSEKLREGWEKYYLEVDDEYKEFLRKDSIAQNKLKAFANQDTSLLSQSQKMEKAQLEFQVREAQRIINQPLVLPNTTVTPVVYIQIGSEERRSSAKQLVEKITDLGYKAPGIELVESARNMSANEIRYFRESDETFAKVLQVMLKNQNIETNLKPIFGLSNKTKAGTIELWLK
ncbi:MAG TPA: hypothetical protein VFC65_02210 [Prolixibacteraceae bacterium]|nr:hypothetical protein [Prolixibacteraceae bacterium]